MSVHFKVQEPMYVHACIYEKQILLSRDSREGRYSSNGTIHPVRCSPKDVSKGVTDERECTYNGTLYYLPYSFSSIKCDDVPTKLFWKNLSRNMESVSSFSAAVDNAVPQTFLLVSHHLRLTSLILPTSKDKIDGKKAGFANCCAVVLTRDGGPRMLFGGFPDKVSKYAYAGHPDSSGKVVTLENVITTEVFRLLRDWCNQLSANVHVIVARHANSMHNAPMRIVDRFSRSPLDSTLTLLGQAQATIAGTAVKRYLTQSTSFTKSEKQSLMYLFVSHLNRSQHTALRMAAAIDDSPFLPAKMQGLVKQFDRQTKDLTVAYLKDPKNKHNHGVLIDMANQITNEDYPMQILSSAPV